MFETLTQRRYLIPFRASRLPQQVTDVLVIGGGVAGLRAAIAAAQGGAEVLLLCKDTVEQSNTWYAQGGIAAVLQPLDSVEAHVRDTELVGVGLCDEAAVRAVVEEGPRRVLELLSWGANFDRQAGNAHDLAFGLEGGHSYARILHAYGDATGKELASTLINKVRGFDSVRISEDSFAIDLITDGNAGEGSGFGAQGSGNAQMRSENRDGYGFSSAKTRGKQGEKNRDGYGFSSAENRDGYGFPSPSSNLEPAALNPSANASRCLGVLAMIHGEVHVIWARRTVLASGGAGQLWRESSNPKIATADGHAMAYRAGATLRDMEMVQFHPTTLYVAGSSRALITEAVRGEGAYLIDRNGHRFMPEYHKDAELAPRDVVARAIVEQIRKTFFTHVFLDVRHLDQTKFAARFPQLAQLCAQFDIDPATDPIPVHPATHYMIGGVDCDLSGRTRLGGLYAVGEASCSGLHGANRLASNSLLEGLVFGARAGEDAARAAKQDHAAFPQDLEHRIEPSAKTELDVADVKSSLRSVMWRNVGIERTGERLAETSEIIALWSRYVMDKTFDPAEVGAGAAVAGWELQNMLTACALITSAAQARTESRGAHYRLDHPDRDDARWRLHLLWRRPMETPIAEPVA